MKKHLKRMIMTSLLVVTIMITLNACGCRHEWNPATCTSPKTCTKCGKTEGEPLGHNEVKDHGKDATLLNEGMSEGSHCDRCGKIIVQQKTIPAKIDVLKEEIKTNPDKINNGTYYVKNYHLKDFLSKDDFLTSDLYEATDSALVFEYDTTTNDLSLVIWFLKKNDSNVVSTKLFGAVVSNCTPATVYDYVYQYQNGYGYTDMISGEFAASNVSTTDSFNYSNVSAGSGAGFYMFSDQYKEEAALFAKQLIKALDKFFDYINLDIKASEFNLK